MNLLSLLFLSNFVSAQLIKSEIPIEEVFTIQCIRWGFLSCETADVVTNIMIFSVSAIVGFSLYLAKRWRNKNQFSQGYTYTMDGITQHLSKFFSANRKMLILLSTFSIIFLVIGMSVSPVFLPSISSGNTANKVSLALGSPQEPGVYYFLQKRDAKYIDGKLSYGPWYVFARGHNVLTNFGRNYTRDCMWGGGCGTQNLTKIAVGNSTNAGEPGVQSPANVTLANEMFACGFSRTAATIGYESLNSSTNNANGNISLTTTFTNTCSYAVSLNSTGIYNSTSIQSNNTLFSEFNFTPTTFQSNDQLNDTGFIWIP